MAYCRYVIIFRNHLQCELDKGTKCITCISSTFSSLLSLVGDTSNAFSSSFNLVGDIRCLCGRLAETGRSSTAIFLMQESKVREQSKKTLAETCCNSLLIFC